MKKHSKQLMYLLAAILLTGFLGISISAYWIAHGTIRKGIFADLVLLQLMLRNILHNTIKYSPKGSPITVSVTQESGAVVISMEDEGRSIDPADIPFLFQPFRRGRNCKGITGSGLGLYLIQSIAKAHHGEAVIYRCATGGCGVRIRLALHPQSVRADDSQPAARPYQLRANLAWRKKGASAA